MTRTRLDNARYPLGEEGARVLDDMNGGRHAELSEWAFSQLDIVMDQVGCTVREDALMLDVGCGGGANLLRLLERVPRGHVTGIDHSPVSVAKSRETCAAAIDRGRCDVIEGDVGALPLDSARLDLVTAFETVYFWPDPDLGLAECARVLADGGVMLVCNEVGADIGDRSLPPWADGLSVYRADDLVQHLSAAGFTTVVTRESSETGWLCGIAVKGR